MVINIINLDPWQPAQSFNPSFTEKMIQRSREERVLSIVKQSKEHGFACRFWEGVINKHGGVGITQAFKKIVRWAKENNLPMVPIGEDDLQFSAPGAWQYYLDNMPEDFDIYSGGIYSGQLEGNRIVNGYSGNTLITIKNHFYDFILSANEDPKGLGLGHLDRWLGCFAFEKKYIVSMPYVVLQSEGYSDNLRRETRHSSYLENMPLFGR